MAFSLSKITEILGLKGDDHDGDGAVGIDIGSSSIKVVQLKRARGSAVLETYGELQLGPYANTEIGRATNLGPSRLTEALVDIVREASVTSKNAALSIPYTSSFVTVISLPTTDESRLSTMVPIEARKYVPIPVNEVTLDWFVVPVPKGSERGKRETDVLLAAIHNEALNKYQTVVKNAAMLLGFTEIEVFSTIRSSVMEQDTSVLIIDLGAATSKFYIVDRGIVRYTHSMTLGSQDMTLSLSKSLQISVTDAEELKRQVGLTDESDDPRVFESLTFNLERVLGEAARFVARYEKSRGVSIEKTILTGGGGVLRGLEVYAQDVLGRTAVLADPFSKVEYPAFLEDTLKEAGPSFAAAVGVALRRLNE